MLESNIFGDDLWDQDLWDQNFVVDIFFVWKWILWKCLYGSNAWKLMTGKRNGSNPLLRHDFESFFKLWLIEGLNHDMIGRERLPMSMNLKSSLSGSPEIKSMKMIHCSLTTKKNLKKNSANVFSIGSTGCVSYSLFFFFSSLLV